jgi:hypothetical protein
MGQVTRPSSLSPYKYALAILFPFFLSLFFIIQLKNK